MDYKLFMIICSLVAGECTTPYEMPNKYNGMYDCLNAGYAESLKKSKEIGREEINQHQIYIRFICQEQQEILPLPKPEIGT